MINPKANPDGFFTVKETAEFFHVHPKTVLNWIYEGTLDATQPSKSYLISGESILKRLRQGKVIVI
jgi:excisionase family DNA binding protein